MPAGRILAGGVEQIGKENNPKQLLCNAQGWRWVFDTIWQGSYGGGISKLSLSKG